MMDKAVIKNKLENLYEEEEQKKPELDLWSNILDTLERQELDLSDWEKYEFWSYEAKLREQEVQERISVIQMRKLWGKSILSMIWIIVAANIAIMAGAWMDYLNFSGVILPVFIGQSLLQVLWLGYIVTKFLFNEVSLTNWNGK